MTNVKETLEGMARRNVAKFLENATPATSRQINFLAAIIANNNIALEEVVEAVDHYNGGFDWGMDKETASLLIAVFATPADMKRRLEKIAEKKAARSNKTAQDREQAYCDECDGRNGDDFNDFNYVGSRHHY